MKCGAPKDKVVKKTQIKTMFISKYGDGYGLTYSMDINMNENGEIYIGILDPFNQEGGVKLWFPFYVMMYMFDAQNDEEIANYILFNIADYHIREYVENAISIAFRASYIGCRHEQANVLHTKDKIAYIEATCSKLYEAYTEDNKNHFIPQFIDKVLNPTILIQF
jgi:hypothetical protein